MTKSPRPRAAGLAFIVLAASSSRALASFPSLPPGTSVTGTSGGQPAAAPPTGSVPGLGAAAGGGGTGDTDGQRVVAASGTAATLQPTTPGWSPELDEPLRRALISGCRAGILELRALAKAGGPSSAIAAEVVRLCEDIRSRQPSALAAGAAAESAAAGAPGDARGLDRSGRSRLVLASAVYGIWAGIAFDILADVEDGRMVVLPPMLGLAAGLGASIYATRSGEITAGQAWAVITGLDYGTYSGLLWSAAADSDEERVFGTALATGVAGGLIGVLAARFRPAQGSVELVRSGGLWGTATTAMLALMSSNISDTGVFTMLAAGMDLGLLGGGLLATQVNVSRDRMLLIDTGAITGLLFGLGTTWLIAGIDDNRQAIGAGGLAGLLAGIAIAVVLTQDMDADDAKQARAPTPVPAFITRDTDGHWRSGGLSVVPLFGPPGSMSPVLGATATLIGGAF